MTLDEWIAEDCTFPPGSVGFKLRGGRVVWENAWYPDRSTGRRVAIGRIITEGTLTFGLTAYVAPQTSITFVSAAP